MTAVVKTAKRAPLVPLFYPNWITLWRRERCYLQSIEQIPGFNPIIVILSSEDWFIATDTMLADETQVNFDLGQRKAGYGHQDIET